MANQPDRHARAILPIPDPQYVGLTTYDAKDPATTFPPIEPLRPPAGAPNILIVLIDDAGFGASSAFGGPCQTPNAERLAANGLKYTRFHTTALCSPTRAALLTGRNHHAVGMGHITENASASPGRTSVRPNYTAPLPEITPPKVMVSLRLKASVPLSTTLPTIEPDVPATVMSRSEEASWEKVGLTTN